MRIPNNGARSSDQPNSSMTPMIDVVFQLLIYFLCTASFAASEQFLPTILPPTGAAANEPPREIQELELVEISLSQAADTLRIELNGNAVSSIAELRDRLLQLVALAKLPVVLDIGPEVHLSNVVAVYDLCVVIGLNGIHFAAPNTN